MSETLSFESAYQRQRNRRHAPIVRVAIISIVILFLVGAPFSGSPLPVLAGGTALAVVLLLLWQPDDLPILLLPIINQWSQVATKPIVSVFSGLPIDRVLDPGYGLQNATDAAALFGFAGVTCLSLGMRLGAGSPHRDMERALRLEAQRWDGGLILRLSLGALVLGRIAEGVAYHTGPALQLVLAFSGIASVGLFSLAYWCFINKKGYRYLVPITISEIAIGFTGFFADFRIPIFVFAIAALAARPRVRPITIAALICGSILILGLASFWSEIKMGYRQFVNNGTGAQVVIQPLDARVDYIYNSALQFDGSKLADGFNKFLARLSYIDFLGATMDNVPSNVPHEDGWLIGSAILNMVEPRIFFPDKPPLPHDTDITVKYTGIDFRNSSNTSISIGYLGELYIDFGYVGALIATGLVGFTVGFGYRILRDYEGGPRLISYGTCCMVALPLLGFETALAKSVNGAVLGFAAALVIQRIIAPRVLARVARKRRRPVPASADIAPPSSVAPLK